jgi:3-dehydroquinate synthase
MSQITVTHPDGFYPIYIGRNIYPTLHETLADKPYVVISDSNVAPLYANQFPDALAHITFPAGEPHKNLQTVNQLYSQLLAAGLDRFGTIVALGGGVTGDMAGFVAATYMRGVKLVQCPTSLLAMVDSSVGGKVGVDLPEGKNLVGAFKQPVMVLVDLETLHSLPADEFASGMAEVIKHGVLDNPELFTWIEQNGHELAPNHPFMEPLVTDAIEVKRATVQADPYELHGKRALLNLGHTFGHAIEQVSGYRVKHGFGVAMGMVVAAQISAEKSLADPSLPTRIENTLHAVGLPTRIPANLDIDAIIAAMGSDKKKKSGRLRYILPRGLGDCMISADLPPDLIRQTLLARRENL